MKPLALDIVYEDADFVIINKQPKVLTIPDRFQTHLFNLYNALQERYGEIFIVHRLDRETSGIICFARTVEAHRSLCQQFEARTVDKQYWALVQGTPDPSSGRIENYLGEHPTIPGKMIVTRKDGKKSITEYETVETFKAYTLMNATIRTGRQHQIRVHFAKLGYPLAIDPLYAKRDHVLLSDIKRGYKRTTEATEVGERALMTRLTLHAHTLRLDHPTTAERLEFTAEPPKDLQALLTQLRRWGK